MGMSLVEGVVLYLKLPLALRFHFVWVLSQRLVCNFDAVATGVLLIQACSTCGRI